MDAMCVRCARLAATGTRSFKSPAQRGLRTFSTSNAVHAEDQPSDTGVAAAGRSINRTLKNDSETSSRPQRPLIRKYNGAPRGDDVSSSGQTPLVRRTTQGGSTSPPARGFIRRTAGPEAGQGPQATAPPRGGQLLKRSPSAQPGQLLRRTGGTPGSTAGQRTSPGGQLLRRSGAPGAQRTGGPQRPATDQRRRKAVKKEDKDDGTNAAALEQAMDEYITKFVDRPENPTEPIPYNPKPLKFDDLRVDWPNTPLSKSGLTESVVQKIQWLARRLPHGYQSPEQLADRYLKNEFISFESEEEKQQVLKIASELTTQAKQDLAEGSKTKAEIPFSHRFADVDFASLGSKEGDANFLLQAGIKGGYAETSKQPYPFLQSAARMLGNNGSYGPASSQRLLSRVQGLIPQRGAAAQQARKA